VKATRLWAVGRGSKSSSIAKLCMHRVRALATTTSLRPIVAMTIAATALSACGGVEPWVKPYERAALADTIMAASRNPVADDFMLHVYEVREGARGAAGSAGGGCGCN